MNEFMHSSFSSILQLWQDYSKLQMWACGLQHFEKCEVADRGAEAGQCDGMVQRRAVDEGTRKGWVTAWVLFQEVNDLKWWHGKEMHS